MTDPTQDEIDTVIACCRAIAPIEAKGMTLGARLELAAAFLSMALQQASEAADEHAPSSKEDVLSAAEEAVVRRAYEILEADNGNFYN